MLTIKPLDQKDIEDKIFWLSAPENREELARKARSFSFSHTWEEIAREILAIGERVG